jgi:hypothetical protein
MMRCAVLSASAFLTVQATAQLYGVTAAGVVVQIDTSTGAATVIGSSGFDCNAATGDSLGRILIGGGGGVAADQIIAIDPLSASGSVLLNTVGRPPGYGIRGMAMGPANALYVVLSASSTAIDTLATINMTTGAYTVIGPTNRTDIQSLAMSPAGDLFAVGIAGGNLYQLNTITGAATVIGGGTFAGDDQALEFLPDGTALACRAHLRSLTIATGATTLIGATGQTDVRGLAFIGGPTPPTCYANCDGSTASPLLTANDFSCFLNRYVNAESYADCDGVGGLTANDFQCFLGAYVAGCS